MVNSAKPQYISSDVGVKEVWPEYWGLTLSQVREFLSECQQDPAWRSDTNVYTLVEKYVKPMTQGSGLGYALMKNLNQPKEVNVMVSHAWAENAEEFLQTLQRTVQEDDVMFICALSLYQCEDGCGPSLADQLGLTPNDSPFRRVLQNIAEHGKLEGWRWRHQWFLSELPPMLLTAALSVFFFVVGSESCIPSWTQCAKGVAEYDYHPVTHLNDGFTQGGCIFPRWFFTYSPLPDVYKPVLPLTLALVFAAALAYFHELRRYGYRGRMVAVPNRECDLYTRLWCTYEICAAAVMGVHVELARTLATAGTCSARESKCSNKADMDLIFGDMARVRYDLSRRTTFSFATRPRHTSRNQTPSLQESPAQPGDCEVATQISTFSEESSSAHTSEVLETCGLLDTIIRRVMRQSKLVGLYYIVKWMIPYLIVRVSMTVAEQGSFSPAPLFDSRICAGIYSHVLAVGIFGCTVGYAVIRAEGLPSTKTMLTVSFVLTCVSLLSRGLDATLGGHRAEAMARPPPLHHCFGLELGNAGLSLGLCTLHARWWPAHFYSGRGSRVLFFTAILSLVVLTCLTTNGASHSLSPRTYDQYYPVAVWNAAFRLFSFVFPLCFIVSSVRSWGIQLKEHHVSCRQTCAKTNRADALTMPSQSSLPVLLGGCSGGEPSVNSDCAKLERTTSTLSFPSTLTSNSPVSFEPTPNCGHQETSPRIAVSGALGGERACEMAEP